MHASHFIAINSFYWVKVLLSFEASFPASDHNGGNFEWLCSAIFMQASSCNQD
jgi:hypothetical protein